MQERRICRATAVRLFNLGGFTCVIKFGNARMTALLAIAEESARGCPSSHSSIVSRLYSLSKVVTKPMANRNSVENCFTNTRDDFAPASFY